MDTESTLNIHTEYHEEDSSKVRMFLNGRLAQLDVKRFRSEVEKLISRGFREIEVDLRDLQYIDSGGVAELVPIYQSVQQRNGSLRIINPRRLIRHILVSAHLTDLIEIGPSHEQ
jgi:anti-anti-sigma factor